MENIEVTYLNGPKVSIIGNGDHEYFIDFIDNDSGSKVYSTKIKSGMWSRSNRKWFTNWKINLNGNEIDYFNLEGKKVKITLDSKAIGDTIAWAPYAVEFLKKHKCEVYLATSYNYFFENLPEYKEINFINFGDPVNDLYTKYNIGWYKKNGKWEAYDKYPNQVNQFPLQKTATDILGLEYREVNHGIYFDEEEIPIKEKYVVFAPQASSGCKEWTNNNWRILSKMFMERGYEVVVLSKGRYYIENTINIWGKSLNTIFNYLNGAEYFIGLGSGLSWANWALEGWTYMINGFSGENHEFSGRINKISNNKCIKCWTDPVHVFDPSDWNWCPVYKGSKLQHICQKSITPEQVIKSIFPDV